MTLDKEDIDAIAAAVVRRLDVRTIARELHRLTHEMSEVQMDAAYWVTLPHEEKKRLWQAQRAVQLAEKKAAKEAGIPPSAREIEWWKASDLNMSKTLQQRAKEDRIEVQIRELSLKIPAEFRPLPEQYRSHDRKVYILELVKDPARWSLIPSLKKQWPNRKRTAWEDGVGPSPADFLKAQWDREKELR
jgi:hypothetical protein